MLDTLYIAKLAVSTKVGHTLPKTVEKGCVLWYNVVIKQMERTMIYVTGDTHGMLQFDKLQKFAKRHTNLTKDDYVIICGDFGGVWSESTLATYLNNYQNLPFSVLWVDGNHENFDMLEKYPVEMWNGGKVQFVQPTVIRLMRGQVFTICGKKFFTFGGGTSVDKARRTPGVSWWEQEIPSYEELSEAIVNLRKHDYKVDFVITHSVDEHALSHSAMKQSPKSCKVFQDNVILSVFENCVDYKHWYFGHYHLDEQLSPCKTALFHQILKIV